MCIAEEHEREGGDGFQLWGIAQEASPCMLLPQGSLSCVIRSPRYRCGDTGSIHSAQVGKLRADFWLSLK